MKTQEKERGRGQRDNVAGSDEELCTRPNESLEDPTAAREIQIDLSCCSLQILPCGCVKDLAMAGGSTVILGEWPWKEKEELGGDSEEKIVEPLTQLDLIYRGIFGILFSNLYHVRCTCKFS